MLERVEVSDLSPEFTRETRPAPSLDSISSSSPDRNEAIRRAYASTAYSLTEIAKYFDIHISTASRIAREADAKRKT